MSLLTSERFFVTSVSSRGSQRLTKNAKWKFALDDTHKESCVLCFLLFCCFVMKLNILHHIMMSKC